MKVATKCGNADKYKGLRRPKCGCDVCLIKFELAETRRLLTQLISASQDAEDAANSASGAASAALYVANLSR